MNQSILYMYHLDDLRRSKKITVETFCSSICSDRQYRRLLSGEQNVSDRKIYEFCNKLGISPKDFYYSANEKDRYEYIKITKLYTHLNRNELNEFNIELQRIKRERIVSLQNKRFLDYCIVRYQYITRKIKDKQCIDKLSVICRYPENLDYESFDFVDIISLTIIAEIEVNNEKEIALKLLWKILTSSNLIYISSESRHILPNIYGTVSILLSRLKKYEEAYQLANEGIDFSIRQSNFSTLTHLYYVNFYTCLKMNKHEQAEKYAVKSLSNAIARGNKSDYEMTFQLIKKNLKTDPILLFNVYKNELFD